MSRRSRILSTAIPLAVTLILPAAVASAAPSLGPETTTPVAAAPVGQQADPQPRPDTAGERKAEDAVLRYAADTRTSKVTISEPGSSYVKVHFASLRLLPGDRVTVADPSGREVHTYHGDPTVTKHRGDSSHTVHGRTGFAAMSIDGDTAVVTLHSATRRRNAAALTRQGYGARIDAYFRGFSQAEYVAANPRTTSVCGADDRRDVTCYKESNPTEYAQSRAVARQLLKGVGHCTAWRVGNTNRMLTNQHCMENANDLKASELQFDYECSTCGGRNPRAGVKVSGAELLKLSPLADLDYALFSVNNFDSVKQFGTLYLETREPTANERIYIPGHGDTLPKRLSLYEDGGAHCKIARVASGVNTGYLCDTSGGNSGSPVLAGSSHKVIALHHLGGCPNWGTRISLVYREIAGLIDNTPGAADSRAALRG
ncbi:V8-like Glu-specific endopeptidase [Actinomadura pelletieri DSM 43383]|uniref:V8-like Glu-specific endopeptidase n=1 Tax=Actinomadura pelletieri DSM 43383 TaxID=1120940 RepID=A0A495QXZ6_9ACTN|nr:trypsin-like peptidase domain-containing protein [Actinomadura pelletieri]RKS78990.1 V8-like Glu-specific endopeptidase [Actinomadura pelletieri DSM 43383]